MTINEARREPASSEIAFFKTGVSIARGRDADDETISYGHVSRVNFAAEDIDETGVTQDEVSREETACDLNAAL
jgi:hypothetical protein